MKYLGSKARIARYISPIIQDCINANKISVYIEPFVGGGNTIDKISCPTRYGSDNNKYLIALLSHMQSGLALPESMSRQEYNAYRTSYRKQDNLYPDWLIGCAGFLASFGGRFFDGGYANPNYSEGRYRDYYREARDNIITQFAIHNLDDVIFQCKDYREYIDIENTVIYCDPPYQGVKQYASSINFDHDEFWNFIRRISQKNYVFTSELNAPDDFTPIWSGSISRSINHEQGRRAIEKLFIYKKGLH